MVLIIKGAVDATLTLVCPHCHYKQRRAKKPKRALYVCRSCHKRFRREDQTRASSARKTQR